MLFSSHIDGTAYAQSCLWIRIFINSIGKKIKLPFKITAEMSGTGPMWDLGSFTRDQDCVPWGGSAES